jgi:crotonobetainyl-CoA:carnitine CoA-transferase CaiB-like acyl-CoA transferase
VGNQPLRGTRVLDLSAYWAGPMAARLLADLAADVIKVESIQRIDGWRGAFAPGRTGRPYETAAAHNSINVNKRGITLNLRSEAGVALCKQLVAVCDVLIENFSPRVMPQFGLAYPVLRAINPGLVMVSLSGFGATGPWRDYVSYAATVECTSGLVGLTGYQDGSPLMQSASSGDPLGGLNGGVAAMMALYRQRRTGDGCYIDLSQVEGVTALLGDQLLDYAINRRVPARGGNATPEAAPHNVYPCAGDDQWIAIAVHDEAQWRGLCAAIDRTNLATDPRFATLDGRKSHEHELDELVAAWTCSREKHEAMTALQRHGVPAGVVQSNIEVSHDPQLRARGFWQELDREWVGRHPYGGLGMTFDGSPPPLNRPAPTLGQHTHEVLSGLLGLTTAELDRLATDGVIGTEPLGED